MASGNTASAPACTQATRRSIMRSRPSLASASLRAMTMKLASVRASTAALTRSTISSRVTTSLPGRWPQRLACTWSSMCRPAAPALLNERTVRAMLKAEPQPVSASTSSGKLLASVMRRMSMSHVIHGADAEIRQAERIRRDTAAR